MSTPLTHRPHSTASPPTHTPGTALQRRPLLPPRLCGRAWSRFVHTCQRFDDLCASSETRGKIRVRLDCQTSDAFSSTSQFLRKRIGARARVAATPRPRTSECTTTTTATTTGGGGLFFFSSIHRHRIDLQQFTSTRSIHTGRNGTLGKRQSSARVHQHGQNSFVQSHCHDSQSFARCRLPHGKNEFSQIVFLLRP